MDYWIKQTEGKPLFEDIMWSRPETKHGRGKLLVVGGNLHGFSASQQAFASASQAGAGHIRLLLPEALRRTVGTILENTEYAPSTSSGSFGQDALNELLINSSWSDGVLLAGDLGRNSETSILLEKFLGKYSDQLTITKDAVDYFYNQPRLILDRPETTIVLSLAQLQKLGTAVKFETPFLLDMGVMLLVQALHDFTLKHSAVIITKEVDNILVARAGKVSSTKISQDKEIWRVESAAKASVFWLQNPTKPLEAITSAFA